MDPTFSTYRQGAWLYDPIYRRHRANEASFLSYCARSDPQQTSVRIFIVDRTMTSDWAVRLPKIGRQMLQDGWTIAIIDKDMLSAFELGAGDVVGEHVIEAYQEGDAFDYRFERKPRKADRFRDKVRDYMAAHTEMSFASSRHAVQRFEENCNYLARTSRVKICT